MLLAENSENQGRSIKKPKMVGVAATLSSVLPGSEGKSKACRVKDMNPVNVPQSRISERLRLKKRRKEIQVLDKMIASERQFSEESPSITLEIGNPDHQEFFLSQLGLVPSKSRIANTSVSASGRISIDSQPDSYLVSSDSYNSSDESRMYSSAVNSDGEDSYRHYDSDGEWDLELVICPCDIPEFYEEICRKQNKFKVPQRSSGSSIKSPSRPVVIPNGRDKTSSVVPVANGNNMNEKPKLISKPQLTVKPQSPVVRKIHETVEPKSLLKISYQNSLTPPPRIKPKTFAKSAKPISSLNSIEDIRMHLLHLQTDLEYVE